MTSTQRRVAILLFATTTASAATIRPSASSFLFPADSEFTYTFRTYSFAYNFPDVLPTQVRFTMYGNPVQDSELSAYQFHITLRSQDNSLFTDPLIAQPVLSTWQTGYSAGSLTVVSGAFTNIPPALLQTDGLLSSTLSVSISNLGPDFLVDRMTQSLSSAFSVSLIADPCGQHSSCSVGASTFGLSNSLVLVTPDPLFPAALVLIPEDTPTSVPEPSNLVPLGLGILFGLRRVLAPAK